MAVCGMLLIGAKCPSPFPARGERAAQGRRAAFTVVPAGSARAALGPPPAIIGLLSSCDPGELHNETSRTCALPRMTNHEPATPTARHQGTLRSPLYGSPLYGSALYGSAAPGPKRNEGQRSRPASPHRSEDAAAVAAVVVETAVVE